MSQLSTEIFSVIEPIQTESYEKFEEGNAMLATLTPDYDLRHQADEYRFYFEQDLARKTLSAIIRSELDVEYNQKYQQIADSYEEREVKLLQEVETLKGTLKKSIEHVKSSLHQHDLNVKELKERENTIRLKEEEHHRSFETLRNECNRSLLQAQEGFQVEIARYKNSQEDLQRKALHLEARNEAQQIAYDALMRKYKAIQEQKSVHEGSNNFSVSTLLTLQAELRQVVSERDAHLEQIDELKSNVAHYRFHLIRTVDLYNSLLQEVYSAQVTALNSQRSKLSRGHRKKRDQHKTSTDSIETDEDVAPEFFERSATKSRIEGHAPIKMTHLDLKKKGKEKISAQQANTVSEPPQPVNHLERSSPKEYTSLRDLASNLEDGRITAELLSSIKSRVRKYDEILFNLHP